MQGGLGRPSALMSRVKGTGTGQGGCRLRRHPLHLPGTRIGLRSLTSPSCESSLSCEPGTVHVTIGGLEAQEAKGDPDGDDFQVHRAPDALGASAPGPCLGLT